MSLLHKLDLFRGVQDEYSNRTLMGAIVSLVCYLCVGWLLVTEYLDFRNPPMTSRMVVDRSLTANTPSPMLQINMNISFWRIPCAALTVGAQDVMRSKMTDIGGTLLKTRLDTAGRIIEDSNGNAQTQAHWSAGLDSEVSAEEGCQLHGFIRVHKVAGDVHMAAVPALFDTLPGNVNHWQPDSSHTIHTLWFGETVHLLDVAKAASNPLRNTSKLSQDQVGDEDLTSFEYYLDLIPSSVQKGARTFMNYQVVSHSLKVKGRYQQPSLYFRFDLSPLLVEFFPLKESLAHFLVQVCAIVGGVFTVLGILNGALHASMRSVVGKKRRRRQKLALG